MDKNWKDLYKVRFGNALEKYRKAKKFSIRKLSRETGLSASYLSYLERGVHGPPSVEATKKIADALEVNPDILLAEAGHVDREITDAIRNNPEQITSAIRNVDSPSKKEDPWEWIGILFLVAAFMFTDSEKKLHEFETPEQVYDKFKEMINEEEVTIEEEKKSLEFAENIIKLWKTDLKKRAK